MPADADVHTGIGKCSACGEIVNIFKALGLPDPGPSPGAAASEEIVPRPPRIIVRDSNPGTWSIHWRWFRPEYLAMLGFCVFWDGFLVFWYFLAFTQNGPLMMKIFPILHVAVGVSLTYTVLAGFLNSTNIDVDATTLTVRHGPVPWLGNRRISNDAITQLYCVRGQVNSQKNPNSGYFLMAVMATGGEVRLATLGSYGEARFLEQQIEQVLAIAPAPVAGECRQ